MVQYSRCFPSMVQTNTYPQPTPSSKCNECCLMQNIKTSVNTTVPIPVLAGANPATVQITETPGCGTITPVQSVQDFTNYSPATDYIGMDTFAYTVTDENGDVRCVRQFITMCQLDPLHCYPIDEDLNFVLMLDVSASIGSVTGAIEAYRDMIINGVTYLQNIQNSYGRICNIAFAQFGTNAQLLPVGESDSFDNPTYYNVVSDSSTISSLVAAITSLSSSPPYLGYTNWEAGLQGLNALSNGTGATTPIIPNVIYFVSDGSPNKYQDGSVLPATWTNGRVSNGTLPSGSGTDQVTALANAEVSVGAGWSGVRPFMEVLAVGDAGVPASTELANMTSISTIYAANGGISNIVAEPDWDKVISVYVDSIAALCSGQ